MKKLLNKGFTIVELVIVIAVIGILAAVLIPTFSNVIESANETADLQEAQSTLKAYTAYMTSKGTPLSDGAVFKIEKTGRSYVFYKGELHKFDASSDEKCLLADTADAPAVYVGKGIYACNRVFTEFSDGDQPGQTNDGYITFFYNDQKVIEFEDGSLKCQIYPGVVVACETVFSKASPEYPDTVSKVKVGTFKNLDNITLTKDTPLTIDGVVATFTPVGTGSTTVTVVTESGNTTFSSATAGSVSGTLTLTLGSKSYTFNTTITVNA